MQSAENEFGALHEWINKQSESRLPVKRIAQRWASARRKPFDVSFRLIAITPQDSALGSALECRLLALSGHRLLARIGSSRD